MIDVLGKKIVEVMYDRRSKEYDAALRFLSNCESVLDVGCGTGTFLAKNPSRFVGIDLNPENVDYCLANGLTAHVGDALQIDFPDDHFDGVFCSHVMQVFTPNQASTLLKELARVTKPDGLVVISTLNWFRRFYRHPENVRAYPPDAIRRLFAKRQGASSPMFPGMPDLEQVDIWVRRTALIEFYHSTNQFLDRVAAVVNALQYGLGIRRYWTYDSYVLALRKGNSRDTTL